VVPARCAELPQRTAAESRPLEAKALLQELAGMELSVGMGLRICRIVDGSEGIGRF
jgi:hypothetical protein